MPEPEPTGAARTQFGMPAIKPHALTPRPESERRPGSLLAGLPALRKQTSSPLTSGEFAFKKPAEGEVARTAVGMPIYQGATPSSLPPEAMPAGAIADAPLEPTQAMQGLSDDQVEPAPTQMMQGLDDDQAEPAPTQMMQGLDEAPVATPLPGGRDDPAHHPHRPKVTQARLEPEGGGKTGQWVALLIAVVAGAAAAWYFLR